MKLLRDWFHLRLFASRREALRVYVVTVPAPLAELSRVAGQAVTTHALPLATRH